MRDEIRIMALSDYSTYQNRDNSLSIKFIKYREEKMHENKNEIDMLIIDSEPEDEPDIDVITLTMTLISIATTPQIHEKTINIQMEPFQTTYIWIHIYLTPKKSYIRKKKIHI